MESKKSLQNAKIIEQVYSNIIKHSLIMLQSFSNNQPSV